MARKTYARIARVYDFVDLPFEYFRYRSIRPLLFKGLSGRILDAGVGTGRNIPFYPAGAEVLGIDLSPAMLRRAERRRARSPARVELAEMDVTSLALPDACFDAAVASFLFCTLPQERQLPALSELARILKPGGALRLLDYTRPRSPWRRAIMKLWEPWAKWAFGASFNRDPEQNFEQCGLEIIDRTFIVDDLIRLVEGRKRRTAKTGTRQNTRGDA